MRRREFITLLGGAAASAWPLAARGQHAKSPVRIGFLPLGSASNTYDRSLVEAFREGLRQVDLVENRDIVLEVVWIAGDPDHAVSDLVQRGAELLVPCGTSASVAAKRQTFTIPIVFISVGNPIGIGLVESLSRPGRNATGFRMYLRTWAVSRSTSPCSCMSGKGRLTIFGILNGRTGNTGFKSPNKLPNQLV